MPTHIEVARQFGDLIAQEDYHSAHALLTKGAQALYTAIEIERRAKGMRTYAPGPITDVEVLEEFVLEEWPAKQEGDVVSIYVSLSGDDFCEAVSVVIAQDDELRIRELEWGRP